MQDHVKNKELHKNEKKMGGGGMRSHLSSRKNALALDLIMDYSRAETIALSSGSPVIAY